MYYNVQVLGLRLGNTPLTFSAANWEASYGTIVDSGTTFSFLPLDTVLSFEAHLHHILHNAKLQLVKQPPFRLCFQA
jgi:hypothetical protein